VDHRPFSGLEPTETVEPFSVGDLVSLTATFSEGPKECKGLIFKDGNDRLKIWCNYLGSPTWGMLDDHYTNIKKIGSVDAKLASEYVLAQKTFESYL